MRKIVCALLAASLLCACAFAESDAFRAGSDAARLGESLFYVYFEGGTDALIRVDKAGKPMRAARAAEIGAIVTHGGALYYLAKEDGAWTLMRRGETGFPEAVYAFDAGIEASRLAAFGDSLFVLLDGQLHIIYPAQKICLRLADARMAEYAVADDYAYFVSAVDIIQYEMSGGTAKATAEAGCLYRLNLSTGNTSLLIKAGVADLAYHAGRLYFHNFADAYLAGEGADAYLAGKLYAFELATETLSRALRDYDWAYFPTDAGLVVCREGHVILVDAARNIKTVCKTGPRAQVYGLDGEILVFDPDDFSFQTYPIK